MVSQHDELIRFSWDELKTVVIVDWHFDLNAVLVQQNLCFLSSVFFSLLFHGEAFVVILTGSHVYAIVFVCAVKV